MLSLRNGSQRNLKKEDLKVHNMSFVLVGMGLSIGGAALGYTSANKAQRKAERKAAKAAEEMDRLKDVYAGLDTSNPYADMENTMEDLTIDQRAYDLEKQQFEQSQSNILGGLREAAGSSGVAAVAQALASESQLAAQSSASRIGQQERENQIAERNMAANLQDKERAGEIWSRDAERDKQATLLGMSQQEVAAYREQAAAAQQAKWDAIAGGVSSLGSMLQGVGASGGEVCCEADFAPPPPPLEDPPIKVYDIKRDTPPCPGLI